MTIFFITLIILIYLFIGLLVTNIAIDKLKKKKERILVTLFWIIIVPCAFVNEIIIEGNKV
jgi:hypothetical protein